MFTVLDPATLPHIRPYRDEDAAGVATMWNDSEGEWPGGWTDGTPHTAERVRREHAEERLIETYLAFADGQVAGYCSLGDDSNDPQAAWIPLLNVSPQFQGRGLGRDLLKRALAHTCELGYQRLSLGTWAGNLKSIPLYKKTGFFWVPDTSVRMQNFLPLLFALQPVQEFLDGADWYATQVRDLSASPDKEKRGKIEVFTYVWRRDGRELRATIDHRARGLLALETDEWAISCALDDPAVPLGGRRTIRWEAQHKQAGPLPVTLVAEADTGLSTSFQVRAEVRERQVWTQQVAAESTADTKKRDSKSPRVRTTAIIGDAVVPLAVAAQPTKPVDVALEQRFWLVPEVPRPTWLTVTNRLDEPVRGSVTLGAADGLTLAPEDTAAQAYDLPAKGRTAVRVTPHATHVGLHQLSAYIETSLVGAGSSSSPVTLPPRTERLTVPSLAAGTLLVQREDDAISVHSDQAVVRTAPKGSWGEQYFTVTDRATGRELIWQSCAFGPPFWSTESGQKTFEAEVVGGGPESGRVVITLTAQSDTWPGVVFRRHLAIGGSPVIHAWYGITNNGRVPRTVQVQVENGNDIARARVALPLREGLVVDERMQYPDVSEAEWSAPDQWAETWAAEYADGLVAGCVWRDARRVEASWSVPSLTFDLGEVAPGETRETPPIVVYAGRGDWNVVRELWRSHVAPTASQEPPRTQKALTASVAPLLFDTPTATPQLTLTSYRQRVLTGDVRLSTGAGVDATPATLPLADLSRGAAWSRDLDVTFADEAAGAHDLTVAIEHQLWDEQRALSVIRGGDRRQPVTLKETTADEHAAIAIDNGRMQFLVVPEYRGGIASWQELRADGRKVEHLHAARPAPGTFVWFNPWYGGLNPGIGGQGPRRSVRPLDEAQFAWEETSRDGAGGVRWYGVRLTADLEHESCRGSRLSISYLTLGSSNLLAVRTEFTNGPVPYDGYLNFQSFLQVDGDRKVGRLFYRRNGLRQAKRVHGVHTRASGTWMAVRNDKTGRTLCAVAGRHDCNIGPLDMGLEGAHLTVHHPLRLAPGETAEGVSFFGLAADLDEALRYAGLTDAGVL